MALLNVLKKSVWYDFKIYVVFFPTTLYLEIKKMEIAIYMIEANVKAIKKKSYPKFISPLVFSKNMKKQLLQVSSNFPKI